MRKKTLVQAYLIKLSKKIWVSQKRNFIIFLRSRFIYYELGNVHMHAIILAGGFGTRLRPLTDDTPKPMLPVNGVPILEHHVRSLVKHGITDITISTGYLPEVIQDHFKDGVDFGANITYSHEDEPLGTGGAVKQAAKDEPFVLVWGDNMHDVDYHGLQQAHVDGVTMVLTQREDVEHFGVAELDDQVIKGFVEKPKKEDAPSNWINAGIFMINPEVLDILPEGESSIEKQCFEVIVTQGKLSAFFHDGQWYPTDTQEKYELAQAFKE